MFDFKSPFNKMTGAGRTECPRARFKLFMVRKTRVLIFI